MTRNEAPTEETPGPRRSPRFLLSWRDWVYLLSLLVPFIVCDLALKSSLIASWPGDLERGDSLMLMRSDLLFGLGYASLWVGLFTLARRGFVRWLVVGLFHAITIFILLLTASAYEYFKITGSTLDPDFILFSLSSSEGLGDVIASELTPGLVALLLAILAYALLGPWLITRFVGKWRDWPGVTPRTKIPWIRLLGVGVIAYALFSFSLVSSDAPAGVGKSISRDAFINLATSAAEEVQSGETPGSAAGSAAEAPPRPTSLVQTPQTEKRNVVVVHLESTRAESVTPYDPNLETTPFEDELAKSSLLAEQAYVVVPHTTNALAAVNCGVDPPLNPWETKTLGDRAPTKCLGDLLKEQGYNTVWFTSSTQNFKIESLPNLVKNFGYDEFYPLETMDTQGFEQANYFGYEDDIMLKPSEQWLTKQKDTGKPFLALYETITPHHQYLAPDRYGIKNFSDNDELNRYQNSVRYQDFFLKNLFDQYKKLGLYDNTIFVIYGDHGEGFGEHGRFQHDNTPYEEGLKIPLIIHDPKRFENGARVTAPVSQLDILPTVEDLLGYEVQGGTNEGYSLLHPIPEDRELMFSCWNESGCLASIKDREKYLYHFGDQPEEIFDLSKDPNERENLAGEQPEEAKKRRQELLDWRATINARYGTTASAVSGHPSGDAP